MGAVVEGGVAAHPASCIGRCEGTSGHYRPEDVWHPGWGGGAVLPAIVAGAVPKGVLGTHIK